jgi:hypothetical protein
MNLRFELATFDEIRPAVTAHVLTLPGRFDSFLEEHILTANHYRVVLDGEDAGFASIHGTNLITQFSLRPAFRQHGQLVFSALKHHELVTAAYVPTCDEYFLSHALDDYRQLSKQAYFFVAGTSRMTPPEFSLRAAAIADRELIGNESGAFFSEIDKSIASGDIFITSRNGEDVGFGVVERSAIYPGIASIGMFTCERHRNAGVGVATISLLISATRSQSLEPIAGCWYYNHLSKRTLERAGMHSPTRLLKIEF